ncbi:MAG: DUF3352 domain-containing protein [Fimbriimonadales bacterium]
MKIRMRGVFAPKILIPLLAVGAVGVGTVGVISLLARSGEAATGMIPADAVVAVTFDNTPSASQVRLFNEIKAAMQDSGMSDYVDDFLNELDPKTGAFKQLRSHVRGSFAMGLWGAIQSEKPDMMVAVALIDPAGAETIVSKLAPLTVEAGLKVYKPKEAPMVISFHEDYAIFATSAATAGRAISVAKGESPNLKDDPEFHRAREALPSDASLMYFINGQAIAKADPKIKRLYASMGVTEYGWMAGGVTLRDEGVQIDGFQPMQAHGEFGKIMSTMKPLGYSSLGRLPAGAIGIAGLSNPGGLVEMFEKVTSAMPEDAPEMQKGIAEMEKETGTSFEKDWMPALRGEVYVALYPPSGDAKEPGVIVSVDNGNGGTATALVKKLIEKANAGEFDSREKVRFTEEQRGDISVYIPSNGQDQAFLGVSGEQAMLFTQPQLLEKATRPSSSLPDSEGLKTFTQDDPSQFQLQLDLYGLVDMLTRMGQAPKDMDLKQVLSSRSLTITAKWDGAASRMQMLIPIDIPELIRVIGKEAKKSRPPQGAGSDGGLDFE